MEAMINLNEINSLEEELALYDSMSEEQAMNTYNVDSKAEALVYIVDYWT